MKRSSKVYSLALLVGIAWTCHAQEEQQLLKPASNLQQAAQKAIALNPEVQAAWHLFQSSTEEERVAEGRFLPKVDLTGGLGNQSNQIKGSGAVDYERQTMGLSLSQMVFDGFATSSEVSRLSYTRLARYYDFMQASSNIAMDAVTYYENILKYRELVRLASENYLQHKKLYDAIVQKVQAGVSRGVDLELATGRLALAESNLLTEATNLHSMSAKYQNVVGELPREDLDSEGMPTTGLPTNVQEALRLAFEGNYQFNSAIEQVLAATSELEARNAPFLPKVELRARNDVGTNVSGIQGRESDRVVELVASYNLFNGGSDTAAKNQFRERLSVARENRDKVCRNVRQELSIAYNDIQQLTDKLKFLNQHQLSIAKAREAYKAQFDIGQRTLLDLLDTENEYFQAKRNYTIAKHDVSIARAQTLNNTGNLLTELKVQREKLPNVQQLRQDRDLTKNHDLACPAETVTQSFIDKSALLASLNVTPVASVESLAVVCSDLDTRVKEWADAWRKQDVQKYLSFYSFDYPPLGMSRNQWTNLRSERVTKPTRGIKLEVSNIQSKQVGNRMEAVFDQFYDNKTYSDTMKKRLVFNNVGGKCLIVDETAVKGRLY